LLLTKVVQFEKQLMLWGLENLPWINGFANFAQNAMASPLNAHRISNEYVSWKTAQEGRRRERDIKKATARLMSDSMRVALVDKIKESHTVSLASEVFGVTRSSYKY
jgi:hypothetical protein